MTAPLLYGLRSCRIILFSSSGPTERITLQQTDLLGMQISVVPEGILNELGSGAAYRQDWTARNVRVSLRAKWAASLPSATLCGAFTEAPGSSWHDAYTIENAEAIRRVLSSAMLYPCTVYPHLDSAAQSFQAQPSESSLYALSDIKRVVHGAQEMELVSCNVGPMTDWEV